MRFVGRAEDNAGRSVVVGAGTGDVGEPTFVGLHESLGNFGALFVEIVRFARIGFHVVEFEWYVAWHYVIGEAGWVDEFPALFAHGYVV